MEPFNILYLDNSNNFKIESRDVLIDLGLDRIIQDIANSKRKFDLESIFKKPLNLKNIQYRYEVFKDLKDPAIFSCIQEFCKGMEELIQKERQESEIFNSFQKEWYFVSRFVFMTNLFHNFYNQLLSLNPKSRALNEFLVRLDHFIDSEKLLTFANEASEYLNLLNKVNYSLRIKGDIIEVIEAQNLSDYRSAIEATFERFRTGEAKDYTYQWFDSDFRLNSLEEEILKGVYSFYPDELDNLYVFTRDHQGFSFEFIEKFYEDIQFYLGYLEYIKPLEDSGLSFCIPEFLDKEVKIIDGFDMNLIHNRDEQEIVLNNFTANSDEHFFIVTGANQGGKTTYAKMIGQIFYLASIGVPLPAQKVHLYLVDKILTHFEQEESIVSGNGLLKNDLIRIKAIIDKATQNSLIILNEIFSSTTLADAVVLGEKIIKTLKDKDCICIYVTFIDQLSRLENSVVSLTALVDDQQNRTFKIVRQASDGKAYAMSIAQKYGLTYEEIKEKLRK